MHGGVVDEESVRLFAMLSQAFAMVTAEHDHRVLINPFLLQEPQKPPNLPICKSDLAIVRLRRIFVTVRLGWTIRKVWIVEMHQKKKLLSRILGEPIQRDIGHNIARTLHLVEIRFVQATEVKVVVIKIKPLIESKVRVQHRRADYRSRLVPGLFENRSQGGLKRAEFV